MQPNEPGQVFTPGSPEQMQPNEQPSSANLTPVPAAPEPASAESESVPASTEAKPALPAAQPEQPETAPPSVPTGLQAVDEPSSPQPVQDVNWTASEYIAHHKSVGWYVLLGAVTLVVAVIVYFVTGRDIVAAIAIAAAGGVFGIYAARKPQVQEYAITSAGISIGQKTYPFSDLKSFAIVDEGALSNITFIPLKRFMPAISIYYDPADEEAIVATLSAYLPVEQRRHDPIDRLMQRIRF